LLIHNLDRTVCYFLCGEACTDILYNGAINVSNVVVPKHLTWQLYNKQYLCLDIQGGT